MKTFKTKEELLKHLYAVAEEYANKYHYQPSIPSISETNWKDESGNLNIVVRQRWLNYRIDIYSPNKDAFSSIEYGRTYKNRRQYGKYHYMESQVFYVKGINLFLDLLRRYK